MNFFNAPRMSLAVCTSHNAKVSNDVILIDQYAQKTKCVVTSFCCLSLRRKEL